MEKFSSARQVTKFFPSLYGKKKLHQLKRYEELIRKFKKNYQTSFCYLASSSGRVEIIGNHTDHNGGRVVGCTIDLDIVAAFLPDESGKITVCGNGYRDIVFDISEIDVIESGSIGMVKGVLAGLKKRGKNIGGFCALLNSNLPSGAGISSSAAFQTLIAAIQNALYNDSSLSPQLLAEVGQYAENVYFNKPCGLLDQGVIAVGGVVTIDFKDGFRAEKLKGNLLGLNLVVTDTGKSHASLTEHYAAIPKEMKAVAHSFGKDRLIDVNEQLFFDNLRRVERDEGVRPMLRAKHFFEENRRVQQVCDAITNNDVASFLQAVNQSGESSISQLQNCSVEDDRTVAEAVEYARKICPSCASRVHGGGFAGTVLAIVTDKDVRRFADEMGKRYGKDKVHVLKVRTVGATVL